MDNQQELMVEGAAAFMEWIRTVPSSQTVDALLAAFDDYLHIIDEADFLVGIEFFSPLIVLPDARWHL